MTAPSDLNGDQASGDSAPDDSATKSEQQVLLEKDSVDAAQNPDSTTTTAKTRLLPAPEVEAHAGSAESKPLIDILDYYYSQHQLKPGHSTALKLPGDVKPKTYYYPVCRTYNRYFLPFVQLASSQYLSGIRLLADWCLVPLFMRLSLDNILKIFTGLLQESKFVFISENLNILSAVVYVPDYPLVIHLHAVWESNPCYTLLFGRGYLSQCYQLIFRSTWKPQYHL